MRPRRWINPGCVVVGLASALEGAWRHDAVAVGMSIALAMMFAWWAYRER